jgi:serine/threonine protein phosphatase 1
MGRTFAIGDIHGDLDSQFKVLSCFPTLDATDTIVFLGDYVDRGPKSAQVIDYVRKLPTQTKGKVVALRGNHEDAWLRVCAGGWDEFVLPPPNGCLAAMRSFLNRPVPAEEEEALGDERAMMLTGGFFPEEVLEWMMKLPFWYEDEHAIYVHAGLPKGPDGFMHPSEVKAPIALLWCRDEEFFRNYRGKLVVFGHTATEYLPQELSTYTPEDPKDVFAGPCVIGLDTGAGKGGFLTAVELPAMRVYESR